MALLAWLAAVMAIAVGLICPEAVADIVQGWSWSRDFWHAEGRAMG